MKTYRKFWQKQAISAQDSIPYREMARDGICRIRNGRYSKTLRFYDINYRLAQNDDKAAIFEGWCDFLNYFDSSIHVEISFVDRFGGMREYESVVDIEPHRDRFYEVSKEYGGFLKGQLSKGNNGITREKYITFAVDAKDINEARPRLERIEADIRNNFKSIGVRSEPLDGRERLKLMYDEFHPGNDDLFDLKPDELHGKHSSKDIISSAMWN